MKVNEARGKHEAKGIPKRSSEMIQTRSVKNPSFRIGDIVKRGLLLFWTKYGTTLSKLHKKDKNSQPVHHSIDNGQALVSGSVWSPKWCDSDAYLVDDAFAWREEKSYYVKFHIISQEQTSVLGTCATVLRSGIYSFWAIYSLIRGVYDVWNESV